MEERVIRETKFSNLKLFSRGKVRDTWELSNGKLLMVATDRISAFDVVVGEIPGKGKILTKMSEFWLKKLEDLIPNHLISTDLAWTCNHEVWAHRTENDLDGRSMIVKKADSVIPIECVVRGYLAGSGWQEYKETGQVCGITLHKGLREADKLDEPIFTPATKAEAGLHDKNIGFVKMGWILDDWLRDKDIKTNLLIKQGAALAFYLRWISLVIYKKAAAYAASRGIIIADTKLEFGWLDGKPILIDEVLTPDSSRFWPVSEWKPGGPQKSFDKQYLRDWLVNEAKWDKKSPPPELPEEVVMKTKEKYEEALGILVS